MKDEIKRISKQYFDDCYKGWLIERREGESFKDYLDESSVFIRKIVVNNSGKEGWELFEKNLISLYSKNINTLYRL